MTAYMPILPIGMMHLFDECKVDDAFILPQFWTNDVYRNYYTSRKWRFVVIDNALYEQEKGYGIKDLIAIAEEIDALKTFIVGPEKIGDGIVTAALMFNAIAEFGPIGDKWRMMAVFQGTPDDMFEMYKNMHEYNIGFAIPVSMHRDNWSRGGLKFFTGIKNRYVHALGIDNITEIPDLVRAGIDSFDSSIVASAAVNGIDIIGSDLRIVRKGLPTDPVRVDLSCEEFEQDIIDATACNIDDINSIISSIRIEAKHGV